MQKKYLIGLLGLLILPLAVYAQAPDDPTSTQGRARATTPVSIGVDKDADSEARAGIDQARRETNQATLMAQYQTAAGRFINQRLTVLNRMLEKINGSQMDASARTRLSTQIEAEISALNSLQSEISLETDVRELRTKIRAIFENRRTYSVFAPKMRALVAVEKMENMYQRLVNLEATLEANIDAQTTEAQAALESYQEQLVIIEQTIALAKEKLDAVSQDDPTLSRRNLAAVKEDFAKIREALRIVRQSIATISGGVQQ